MLSHFVYLCALAIKWLNGLMDAQSAPVNNGQGLKLFHINTDGKAIFINHSLPNNNIVLLWLALAEQ